MYGNLIFLSLRFCPKFCFQILRWNFSFSKQRSVCTFPSTLYIPMYVCRRSNAKGDVRYTSFPNQRLNAIINRHILDQKCTHTYAIGYALLLSSIISWIMISFKKAKCLQTASTINLCRSFHFLFFLT